MNKKSGLRRWALKSMLALAGILALPDGIVQALDSPIKVGYTQSRSGPSAPSAQTVREPDYLLWAEQLKYVLLVEQNVFQALPVTDYGYVLSHGEGIAEGKAHELRGSDLIRFDSLSQTGS